MKRSLIIAAAAAAMATGASASTVIDSSSYTAAGCIGAVSCTIGPATISAAPQPGATLIETTFRGAAGLGVNFSPNAGAGDPVEPEISGPIAGGGSEAIIFSFTPATDIVEIVISHLFSTETFDNDPDEEARIDVTGSLGTGFLTITNNDNTSATGFTVGGDLAGDATVTKLDEFTGQFQITDAFASLGEISELIFTATPLQGPTVGGVPGTRGDYSVTLVSRVPLPAAAWMMIAAFGGLGYLGRRRAAAA